MVTEAMTAIREDVPTDYECPECGGQIMKVVYWFSSHEWHRWTCMECGRDYGLNTPKPTFAEGQRP